MKLFSTEQVSRYHPDKYADQISDGIVTECLKKDPQSRVACECMVKGTTVVLGGEIRTNAKIDYQKIIRRIAKKLNYRVDKIINLIGKQSNEIYNGTTSCNRLTGAGDQGIMFGFATDETPSYLPFAFDFANKIIHLIEEDVEKNPNTLLLGDAKTQVTTDLDLPQNIGAINEILVSACHEKGVSLESIRDYVSLLLSPLLKDFKGKLNINPAGTWNIGGPISDCGLTGRKIVCDQYGGYCAVGGGAFSGKDPSKVDRSAAYIARKIAVDILKKFKNQGYHICEIQLGYAIGQAEPMNIDVSVNNKNATQKIYSFIEKNYDLSPSGIIDRLGLLTLNYEKISEGCHYRDNSDWQLKKN